MDKKQEKEVLKIMSELNVTPTPEEPSFEVSSAAGMSRKWGLFATGCVGGTLLALYAIAAPFVIPAFRRICLPYVPATNIQINNVLKMLQLRSGHLVDIGSGDGRIVIAAAKKGFQADGYEINPWLVWYSRYRAWREGVNQNAKFHLSDLWKVDFSLYTNVVIFGVPQMMPQLEKKLQRELGESARVVACRFPFPHWVPDHKFGKGVDTVWVYNLVTLNRTELNHSTETKSKYKLKDITLKYGVKRAQGSSVDLE